MPVAREDVTGLVLAGGRGVRMGSVDKGLQPFGATTLVEHAIARLAPQVGSVVVSANRHLERYATFGHDVLTDAADDALGAQAGPLAGIHAGLLACRTGFLMVVPCDTPFLPDGLVATLASAFGEAAVDAAVARSPSRLHPVVCLLRRGVVDALAARLRARERSVESWLGTLACRVVSFGDEAAFRNVNTAEELRHADDEHRGV